MKRRTVAVGAVWVVVSVAMVGALAWRAFEVANERVSKASCAYYPPNCTFIVAFPAGHFRIIP